jgi:hypothetical protein
MSTRRVAPKRPTASAPKSWGDAAAAGDDFEGVAQGLGLLEDLLLHVVAVFAQLDGVGRQAGDVHRALDGVPSARVMR